MRITITSFLPFRLDTFRLTIEIVFTHPVELRRLKRSDFFKASPKKVYIQKNFEKENWILVFFTLNLVWVRIGISKHCNVFK